jgi:hypothetical protein
LHDVLPDELVDGKPVHFRVARTGQAVH